MICSESLTRVYLKACDWIGFGAKLLMMESISDHFEGHCICFVSFGNPRLETANAGRHCS